jgi:hypothetical protein
MPVVILVAALAGCAYGGGRKVSDVEVDSFTDGTSTVADVIGTLGPPMTETRDSSGLRVLSYSYVRSQINGAAFIPIVGMFAMHPTSEMRFVTFIFDGAGKMTKHSVTSSQFGN